MQMILIMVRVNKGSGAMSTLTKMAVTRKTTRMTTRLPEILSFCGILSDAEIKAVSITTNTQDEEVFK